MYHRVTRHKQTEQKTVKDMMCLSVDPSFRLSTHVFKIEDEL